MDYTPEPKALVYAQLQFIATSGRMPRKEAAVDYEQLYDMVSAEVAALFLTETAVPQASPVRAYYAVESLPAV